MGEKVREGECDIALELEERERESYSCQKICMYDTSSTYDDSFKTISLSLSPSFSSSVFLCYLFHCLFMYLSVSLVLFECRGCLISLSLSLSVSLVLFFCRISLFFSYSLFLFLSLPLLSSFLSPLSPFLFLSQFLFCL